MRNPVIFCLLVTAMASVNPTRHRNPGADECCCPVVTIDSPFAGGTLTRNGMGQVNVSGGHNPANLMCGFDVIVTIKNGQGAVIGEATMVKNGPGGTWSGLVTVTGAANNCAVEVVITNSFAGDSVNNVTIQ